MKLDISSRTRGTLYAVIGVLALTPDSLLIREVAHVPNFTVMFYRNLAFGVTMFMQLVVTEKANTINTLKALGWWGTFAGLIVGASNLFIVLAFQQTAIANVLVILASNPIFAAIFSAILLRETMDLRTTLTCVVCIGAIVLIFAGELGGGTTGVSGLLYAVASSVTFGLYFALLRWITVGQK